MAEQALTGIPEGWQVVDAPTGIPQGWQVVDPVPVAEAPEEEQPLADRLMALRRQGAAEATSSIPAIIREPFYGAARAGASMLGTALRPFSKDLGDYFAKQGEVVDIESQAVRKDDLFPEASRHLGGISQSLIQAGVMAPAGPYGMAVGFGATEANDALYEAEKAGLKGDDRLKYAATQGVVEGAIMSVFNKFAPGLEGILPNLFVQQVGKRTMQALGKDALKAYSQELPEELITEFGHALAEQQFSVDPSAMDWEKLGPRLVDTAIQTFGAVGIASAASRITQNKAMIDTLKGVQAKGFVSEQDGKDLGLSPEDMKNRRTRSEALKTWVEGLEKEVADAEKVREQQTGEVQGQGQVEVQTAPAVDPAAEVLDPAGSYTSPSIEQAPEIAPGSLVKFRDIDTEPGKVLSVDNGMAHIEGVEQLIPVADLRTVSPEEQAGWEALNAASAAVPVESETTPTPATETVVPTVEAGGGKAPAQGVQPTSPVEPAPAAAPEVSAIAENLGPEVSAIAEKSPPAQFGQIRLEDVQKSFPGSKIDASQDGEEGWDVSLPSGHQVQIRVKGGFKLSEAAINRFEESYGKKLTPEARERWKQRARIAGMTSLRFNGESVKPTAIIRLHRELATGKTLKHESAHVAWKLLATSDFKAQLVKKYSDPSRPESQQEEEVVRAINGDKALRKQTVGVIRKILEAIGLGRMTASEAKALLETEQFWSGETKPVKKQKAPKQKKSVKKEQPKSTPWREAVDAESDPFTKGSILERLADLSSTSEAELSEILDRATALEGEIGGQSWRVAYAVSKNRNASAETKKRALDAREEWMRPGRYEEEDASKVASSATEQQTPKKPAKKSAPKPSSKETHPPTPKVEAPKEEAGPPERAMEAMEGVSWFDRTSGRRATAQDPWTVSVLTKRYTPFTDEMIAEADSKMKSVGLVPLKRQGDHQRGTRHYTEQAEAPAESEPEKRRGRKDQEGAIQPKRVEGFNAGDQLALPGLEADVIEANARRRKIAAFQKERFHDDLLRIGEDAIEEADNPEEMRSIVQKWADAHFDMNEKIDENIIARTKASNRGFDGDDVLNSLKRPELPEGVDQDTYEELLIEQIHDRATPELAKQIQELNGFKVGDNVTDDYKTSGRITEFVFNSDGEVEAIVDDGRRKDSVLITNLEKAEEPIEEPEPEKPKAVEKQAEPVAKEQPRITPEQLLDLLPADLKAMYDEGRDLGFDASRAKELIEAPSNVSNAADLVGKTFLAPFFLRSKNQYLLYMGGELVPVAGYEVLARNEDAETANIALKPERVTEKQEVRHILHWKELGKDQERTFNSYSMAQRELETLKKSPGVKDVDIRTVTTPRADLEVKTSDAPQSITYTEEGGFDVSKMDPDIARLVVEDISTSRYQDELNVSLRDALQAKRDEGKGDYAEAEELYAKTRDLSDRQSEANTQRVRLKDEAKRLLERRAHEIAKANGVPEGRRRGALSEAKQYKSAIAHAKSAANRDPLVKEAERLAAEAEEKYQAVASAHAEAKREVIRDQHKKYVERFGEIEPGTIRVSRKLGPHTSIRMDSWNEKEATYYVSQGAFVESSGQFFQQYAHLQEMTPYAVFEAYGTTDESRTVQAVKMQVDEALAQAKQIRADKEEQARVEKEREGYRARFRTEPPVKTSVARVLPDVKGKQMVATYNGKPAITDARFLIFDEIPKGLMKRHKELVEKRGAQERVMEIENYQKIWEDKTAKPMKLVGYLADLDPKDQVHQALLSDGENVYRIDQDQHDYFAKEGFTFASGEKVTSGEVKAIQIRKGKKVVGAISLMRGDEGGTPLSEVKQWMAPKSKLNELADKLIQSGIDDAKALNDSVRGKVLDATYFTNPKFLAKAGMIVGKFAAGGVLKFGAMIEQLTASIGKAAVDRIRPALEIEWDKAFASGKYPKMEAREKPEVSAIAEKSGSESGSESVSEKSAIADSGGDDLTSIKKAVVNDMREMVGLPEMEGSTPQTVEEWAEQARLTLQNDPDAANDLVNELATNSRPISQHDAMLLQFRYRQLANELKPVVDKYFAAVKTNDPVKIATARTALINARTEMTAFEEIIHASKETWGRAGVALQQLLRKDFSLEAILRRGQEANMGEELTPEQTAELTSMAKQLEDLQKQFDELRKKNEALEAELASQKQHEEAVKDAKRSTVYKKSERRQKVDAKIAAAWDKVRTIGKGKLYSIEGLAVDAVSAATDLIKAYTELGVVTFGEFMQNVRKALGATDADKAEKNFRSVWDHLKETGEIPTIDLTDKADLTREARRIQKTLVENGMTDREQVIDTVHEILKEEIPDLTRRQTMDALSRYGQFQTQSKDEIETLIRNMNAEILKLSQIDQMEIAIRRVEQLRKEGKTDEQIGKALVDENLLVEATGLVRDKPSQTVRQLTQTYNELKKQIPATPEGKAGLLQTILSQMERGLLNRIEDLNWEIEHNERIVREKRERPTSDRIKELEAERDGLRKIHKEMFPPQKKKMTDAQRLAASIRGADRAIETIEKQLAARNFDTTKRDSVSSPELEARQARLKQLRAAREAAKAFELNQFEGEGGQAPIDPARKMYEASLRKRIADYQQILAEGDFSPRPKKQPRTLSASELKLKREMEDVRHKVLDKFAEYHVAHLKGFAWGVDKAKEASHLMRALMTSLDASALLRQGGIVAMSHPDIAAKALTGTILSIAHTYDSANAKALLNGLTVENALKFLNTIDSRQAEFDFMHNLTSGKEGEFRQLAGLDMTSSDQKITKQEEAFSGRWGKYVPWVPISGRLYTMILNKMRADLFDSMVQNLGRNGQVTLDEAKIIANFVNVATGRTSIKWVKNHSAALNIAFFAAQYVASRFQYLAMPLYLPAKGGLKADWRVKRAILKEYARTATGIGTVLGAFALLAALGYDDDDEDRPTIETDSTSSDYLKVKIGETRLDFLAGLQQVIVFSSRMAFGTTKTTSGKVKELGGEGYKPDTRLDVAWDFSRKKFAPAPAAVATIMDDWKNPVGGKETPASLVLGAVTPLSLRDVASTMEEQGVPKGTGMTVLSLLGVGVNTYGPRTEYRNANEAERKKLFKTKDKAKKREYRKEREKEKKP